MVDSPGTQEARGAAALRNLSVKDVLGFALRLMLWFALFVVPWTQLDRVYGACFRFTGNAFVSSIGDVKLKYDANPGRGKMDTMVELKEGRTLGTKATNSRLMGYLPTMFLVALVLATRAPWKLRLRRALIGIGLMSIVVALRVIVDLYATLAPNASFQSVSVSDGFRPVLSFLHELAAIQPSTGFIAAGIIWVTLTLVTEPASEAAAG